MKSIVITINNRKGGVGKTSITLALGSILANRGYKVLLVDLESQNNLTTGCMAADQLHGIKRYVYDAVDELIDNEKRTSASLPYYKIRDNLYLSPSSRSMTGIESVLSMFNQSIMVLDLLLKPIRPLFDFIIMDCPPGAGLVTLNAYYASDRIYVPALMEDDSYIGALEVAKDIHDYINPYKPKAQITGIIMNQYSIRARLCLSVNNNFHRTFPDKIMKTAIRKNIAVGEAKRAHLGIDIYDPKCKAAQDFNALVDEILSTVPVVTPISRTFNDNSMSGRTVVLKKGQSVFIGPDGNFDVR